MPRSREEIEAALNEVADVDVQEPVSDPLPVEPVAVSPEVTGTTEEAEPTEDSFTDYDLSALEPEVAAAAEIARRRMQADYTRKTQAVRDRERQIEERFGDLQLAEDAIGFYERIHNDPSFAMQFVPRMLSALAQSGFDQELSSLLPQYIPSTTQPVVQDNRTYEYEDYDEDDPLVPEIRELRQRLDRYEQMDAQRANETRKVAATQAIVGEWQRQEAAILDSNKHYGEEDLDYIYDLAGSTGGSLFEAQKLYENIQLHGLNRYVASKKALNNPSGSSYVPGTGSPGIPATPAEERGSFKTARDRALARVRAADL